MNEMIMIGYEYWKEIWEWVERGYGKINYEIVNDCKVIKFIQYLWQRASKDYLADKDLSEVWIDVEALGYTFDNDYKKVFEDFKWYLFYSSDRMSVNRWLYCQTLLNLAQEKVYTEFIKEKSHKEYNELVDCEWSNNKSVHLKEMAIKAYETEILYNVVISMIEESSDEDES